MYDIIIIGSGMAGSTASIYVSRQRLKHLLITEKKEGQFIIAGEIANYPGFNNIKGIELYDRIEKQIEYNNINMESGIKIIGIKKENDYFVLNSKDKEYKSKTVIVSTGSVAKKLNVEGEIEYSNKGLSYCAECDGPLFQDEKVAVIGGGNSSLEAANFLKNIAKEIIILDVEEKLKASQILIDNITNLEHVSVVNSAYIKKIVGDNFLSGIIYEQHGIENKIDLTGVFVEIGRIPETDFLEGFVDMDETKHIIIDCQGQTSVEGLYAAGDCTSGLEYQFVIAAGQGTIAALKAGRYLSQKLL